MALSAFWCYSTSMEKSYSCILQLLFSFVYPTAIVDDERLSAEEMDERRRQNIAYEYLCHLEEAKQWVEVLHATDSLHTEPLSWDQIKIQYWVNHRLYGRISPAF